MKTICFPIEVYEREIDTRLLLAIKVASRGGKAIIGLRSNEVFKRISGATFFMSPAHGNTSLKLVQKFEQADNTICFHDEEGFIRQSDKIYLEKRVGQTVRKHGHINFTWNKFQDELLRSIQVMNTCITGSPKFDLPLIMKGPLPDRFRLNINTRFALANPVGEIGLEGMIGVARGNGELTEHDIKRLIERHEKDTVVLYEFLDLLEKIGRDGSIPTAIRVHPAESRNIYMEIEKKYNNIEVESNLPVFDSINRTSVVVHDGCTTAFDAKLMDRRVIALRPEAVGAYYDELANKFSDICCSSADEVYELLGKITECENLNDIIPIKKTMLDDLIPNSKGTAASDLIVDILLDRNFEHISPNLVSRTANRAIRLIKKSLKAVKQKIDPSDRRKKGDARQALDTYYTSKYPDELDMQALEIRFQSLLSNEKIFKQGTNELELRKINKQAFEIIKT